MQRKGREHQISAKNRWESNWVKRTHYAAEILRDDPYLIQQVEVNRFLVIRWESRMAIPPAVSTGQP